MRPPLFLPFVERVEAVLTSSVCRDPVFIRAFKKAHCVEAWTEHIVSKKKCVLGPLLPLTGSR